ncbi:MAG: serine hydrolase, partial [Anaerolineae bacterium]|nr:serine hydrolase [Anaerolineae bacterium]
MIKRLIVPLTLVILLLSGCIPTAQDSPQTFPPDVVAEVQATLDDLTAGELPPGMVVWIDAPKYRFEGASGLANLADNTPMPPEGAFRIGSITKMFTAAVI